MPEFLEITIDKFIFKVAADRLYSAAGVWLLEEGPRVRLGASDYQQQVGGDMTFAHLKPVGARLAVGDELAELETIKANVSLPCPIAGQIVEINTALQRTPEAVNQAPYGDGWLAVIEPADWPGERQSLLTAEAYLKVIQAQAAEELGQ